MLSNILYFIPGSNIFCNSIYLTVNVNMSVDVSPIDCKVCLIWNINTIISEVSRSRCWVRYKYLLFVITIFILEIKGWNRRAVVAGVNTVKIVSLSCDWLQTSVRCGVAVPREREGGRPYLALRWASTRILAASDTDNTTLCVCTCYTRSCHNFVMIAKPIRCTV